ncbi:MAG: LamG domain-containing protein [Candidatus Paceibacterota bacterium]|jgi:prepilin-type N-terminal cleavage/methylation domain-containing protein
MNKSFTLIEILVVIVIVGIISAFIIVSVSGVSQKANIAKGQAFSNSLKNSLLLNLVSEWKLNETSGTEVSDSWSGGNTGTWYGEGGDYTSPSWRTGSECVSGGCLAFDGTDDYVSIVDSDSLKMDSGNITIMAWAKSDKDSYGSLYGIAIKYPVGQGTTPFYGLEISNSNWGFRVRDVSGNSIQLLKPIIKDKWMLLVGVRDGNKAKLYINGKIESENTTATLGSTNNDHPFNIGRYWTTASFSGLIDDVQIYNAAIPTSRIQQNYYSGLSKLLVQSGFDMVEYQQRIGELKFGLSNNE